MTHLAEGTFVVSAGPGIEPPPARRTVGFPDCRSRSSLGKCAQVRGGLPAKAPLPSKPFDGGRRVRLEARGAGALQWMHQPTMTEADLETTLRSLPHFKTLPPDLLARVAERTRVVQARAGQVLFREGDPCRAFYA